MDCPQRVPDENYAREVMQLFSIGLVELNIDGTEKLDGLGQPIPTYSQETIVGFAHVYTGWTFAGAPGFRQARPTRFNQVIPMQLYPGFHDTGAKTLLNGAVLPAGQTGEQDLAAALDNIFSHPNVGPFIAVRLIQRLVTSNPSPGYVRRVAQVFNNNGSGIRGDLAAVVLTATMDSIGAAGVPGVGLITLALVLEQVGLPVEGIGLIIGVDRLLDMVRTAVNITGDSAVTCIVARSEGQLSSETFYGDAVPHARPA